ncbi:hypothetical protein JKG68_29265 [Microvirga aerilata]|uniref:Uncharacterized protein n=1 Tax=Microvirga aerilata TaxID=670292 RepID=A0A936ZD35_9HYPH|nr:hypothetical protein [Microvirga aerilata]MBL0407992.1 hypothetical protein [Microvirga aerilata]
MTEGTSRGSEDGYFKLYTHQKAHLVQLEEENRHLRSTLGDMAEHFSCSAGQLPLPAEDWHKALITIIDAALPAREGRPS